MISKSIFHLNSKWPFWIYNNFTQTTTLITHHSKIIKIYNIIAHQKNLTPSTTIFQPLHNYPQNLLFPIASLHIILSEDWFNLAEDLALPQGQNLVLIKHLLIHHLPSKVRTCVLEKVSEVELVMIGRMKMYMKNIENKNYYIKYGYKIVQFIIKIVFLNIYNKNSQ